jgi:FixJ family two-component response regulator
MSPRKVIVVDDDHENVAILVKLFGRLGFESEGYCTLESVYELAERGLLPERFICVLDHNFPGTEGRPDRAGHELANVLLESCGQNNVRLIYISGVIDVREFQRRIHGRHYSFTQFLEKGSTDFLDELMRLLKELDLQLREGERIHGLP